MKAVVYENMSNEAYHGNKSTISRSGIVEFMKSPLNYWHQYHDPDKPEKESTDAMTLGSAFHALLIEPDLFHRQYTFMKEKVDRRTKAGKEAYDLFCERSRGKTVMKAEDFETITKMAESVMSNPMASELIKDGFYEHSIFWKDETTGLDLKTRPDIWHSNMTVDIKTTNSAHPRAFQDSMVSYGYHLQAAMNREGIRAATGDDIKKHVFVCVEKSFPFLNAVYILDETALQSAHNILRRVLGEMRYCFDNNIWPGYDTQVIGLPNWAITA